MKKRNIIILLFTIVLIAIATTVNAADEACKITISADKTSVKSGDTVTVNLLMSDIKKSTGIAQFFGILEYPEDIFEIIYEEDDGLKEDLVGTEFEKYNMSILYTGEKDTDTTVKNPWYVLHVKENEQNGIFASTLSDPQKTSQIVGRIKFKVKQNIEETPAEILIKDMEAFDADAISSGATSGDKVTDANVILTVNGTSGNGQQNNNGQTNNNQPNNTESGDTKNQIKNTQVKNIENRNKNDNRANNDVPYTGIEDTIPVIFILAVIALLAYINYRRYKNI